MKRLVLVLGIIGICLIGVEAYAYPVVDSYTILMLHADGAAGSTTFVDSSAYNHTVTAVGNAQVDTAQSVFGGASVRFDGSGDYLSLAPSGNWSFGTSDFTIDFWSKLANIETPAGTSSFLGCGDSYYNTGQFSLGYSYYYGSNGNIVFYASKNTGAIYNPNFNWVATDTDWHHIAVSRSGGNLQLFLDGVLKVDSELTGPVGVNNQALTIGRGDFAGAYYLNGWIDEFRISNIARWTADFDPLTGEYLQYASLEDPGPVPTAHSPEPASLTLLGLGLLGLALRRKKTS